MLQGIAGRVALITGAGRGIGKATAIRLAREGAQVCVNDIDAAKAGTVAAQVGGLSAPCDVSDPDAVREQLERCERERGPVDLVVANQAFMVMAPFLDHSDRDFARTFEVNLLGTAWLIGACAPAMAERGYGRIVAIASEWGMIGWPGATAYAASKGAIIALVKSAAPRFARDNVAINAVAPGVTDTPQLDIDAADAGLTHGEMVATYAREVPLGRIGRPEDIAAAVAFLLSADASAFVGQVISPNGASTRV
jgi:2-hydroxycyclohexanecarboxyl-CoA dehydrogenase